MKKENLDDLKVLYESVYDEEYLNEAPGGPARFWDSNMGRFVTKVTNAAKSAGEYLAPSPERSAEPSVRAGVRTPTTGFSHVQSMDKAPTSAARETRAQREARISRAQDAAIAAAERAEKAKAKERAATTPATTPARPTVTTPAATSPAAKPATPGAGAKVAPTAAARPTSSPATATTAQKIKGGLDVYKSQVKSGDIKGAEATGKSTWALANPTLANKQKTPNPLLQDNEISKMKSASVMRQNNISLPGAKNPTSSDISMSQQKAKAQEIVKSGKVEALKQSFEWGSTSKIVDDIADAYASIYEAKKKVDQDKDGDNDFADVRIARMIASGVPKEKAIAAVKNKPYNEEFESWIDSLVEEGYDLSDYTMEEMFDIYLSEAEGSYGETPKAYSAAFKTKMTAKRKPFLKKMMSRTNPANRKDAYDSPRKGMTASDREEARAGAAHGSPRGHDYPSQGPGGITKSAKKLRKQKAMGEFGEAYEIDEATRMRKELGKEGEIATRKELAARSKSFKRSGSVDKTIAAAERGADRPYIKHKRDESDSDRKAREEKQSRTLRGLAASRRGSVRDKPRAGMRGYAAKVEGSDRDLQSARGSARSAGTLTPAEKQKLNDNFNKYQKGSQELSEKSIMSNNHQIYEVVASYLLENNLAESVDSANAIMENMSSQWISGIIQEYNEYVENYNMFVECLDELGYDLSEMSDYDLEEAYGDLSTRKLIFTEARAKGVKAYKPAPTQAEIRANERKARKKHVESGSDKSGYGPDEKFYKPEDKKVPDKETAEWFRRVGHKKKFGRPFGKYQPSAIKFGDIKRMGLK